MYMSAASQVHFRLYDELDSHIHNDQCLWVKPRWAQPTMLSVIEQYDLLRSQCGILSHITPLVRIIISYIYEEVICVHKGMWFDCYDEEYELWYPSQVQLITVQNEHDKQELYLRMRLQSELILLENSKRIAPLNQFTQPSVSLEKSIPIEQLQKLHQVPLYIDYRITVLSSDNPNINNNTQQTSSFRYWVPARVICWSFQQSSEDCSCLTFHCIHRRTVGAAERAQCTQIQVILVECHGAQAGQVVTKKVSDEYDWLWSVAPYKTWSTSENYSKCRQIPSIVELELGLGVAVAAK